MTITQTGAETQIDRRTATAEGLRALANLLAAVPEMPLMRPRIEWCVGGPDEEAIPALQAAADALIASGFACELVNRDRSLSLSVELDGMTARVFHVYDREMDVHRARTSYHSVVRVDASQDVEVAS